MPPDRMLLVYNADQGLFNAVAGWAHKFFSPATYECSLCRITFGLQGMLIPWKNFIERLPFPTTFLHRDEFRTLHPGFAEQALPLVLVERDGKIEILLGASEITGVGGLGGLIGRVLAKLEERSERASLRRS